MEEAKITIGTVSVHPVNLTYSRRSNFDIFNFYEGLSNGLKGCLRRTRMQINDEFMYEWDSETITNSNVLSNDEIIELLLKYKEPILLAHQLNAEYVSLGIIHFYKENRDFNGFYASLELINLLAFLKVSVDFCAYQE